MQLLADVMRAGAGAEHHDRTAGPFAGGLETAGVQHRAPKFSMPSILGMFGVPLTLVASTMCFGRSVRVAPSRVSRAVQRCVASS